MNNAGMLPESIDPGASASSPDAGRDPSHRHRAWRRRIRRVFWACGTLYLGTIAINVYQLVGHGFSHLDDPLAWAQALLFPVVLADRRTPAVLDVVFVALVIVLASGFVWAFVDLQRDERRAERVGQRLARVLRLSGSPGLALSPTPGASQDAALFITSIAHPANTLRAILSRKSPNAIGRGGDNDIVLADPTVSARQLTITFDGSSWRMRRQPDAQPLRVNGALEDACVLHDDDQLVVGNTVMRFELPAAEAALEPQDPSSRLSVRWRGGSLSVPLRAATITVGRGRECDIEVPSDVVSQRHAVLRRVADGDYEIEDAGSTNGLRIAGKEIERQTLRHGDVVTIGPPGSGDVVTLTYSSPVSTPSVSEVSLGMLAEAAVEHFDSAGAP